MPIGRSTERAAALIDILTRETLAEVERRVDGPAIEIAAYGKRIARPSAMIPTRVEGEPKAKSQSTASLDDLLDEVLRDPKILTLSKTPETVPTSTFTRMVRDLNKAIKQDVYGSLFYPNWTTLET